jgi:hypothetical protein
MAAADIPDPLDSWTLDHIDEGITPECNRRISARAIRRTARAQWTRGKRKERFEDLVPHIPAPGEVIHTISDGSFDHWSAVVSCLDQMGPTILYLSTWTMNRAIALDLLDRLDAGSLLEVGAVTGKYFKQRDPSTWSTLYEGLMKRGQRYASLDIHAKVTLLSDGAAWIVLEGSANWTTNPRIEQLVISNDRELYMFHREWLEELLSDQT